MAKRREAVEHIERARDTLAYVHGFGPDFPPEDQTSAELELARVEGDLRAAEDGIPDVDVDGRTWLTLARREITDARACYAAGDDDHARRHIQDASGHLAAVVRRRRVSSTFVVGPDGAQRVHRP